ncbi:hypothetical protein ACJMK2_026327, partial [Sinanodonta woodiana]
HHSALITCVSWPSEKNNFCRNYEWTIPAQRYTDFAALGYMEQNVNKDCQTYRSLLTTGDGNCLFNALSIALCGAKSMCCEIKVRTCIEMACNEQFYITQTYSRDFMLCSPSFIEALMNCAKFGAYSSAWTIQAASDAVNRKINVFYPKVNGPADYIAQLLSDIPAVKQIQTGIKQNVYVVLDNINNKRKQLQACITGMTAVFGTQ